MLRLLDIKVLEDVKKIKNMQSLTVDCGELNATLR